MDISTRHRTDDVVVEDPFRDRPRSALEIIDGIRKIGKAHERRGFAANLDFHRMVEADLDALYHRLSHEAGGHAFQGAVRELIRNGRSLVPHAGSTRPPYEGNLANDAVNGLWDIRLGLEAAAAKSAVDATPSRQDSLPRLEM